MISDTSVKTDFTLKTWLTARTSDKLTMETLGHFF